MRKNMVYKPLNGGEKVAKRSLPCHICLHIMLQTCRVHGQSVTFNHETSRFKREKAREIFHASCLNANGSIWYMNISLFFGKL